MSSVPDGLANKTMPWSFNEKETEKEEEEGVNEKQDHLENTSFR